MYSTPGRPAHISIGGADEMSEPFLTDFDLHLITEGTHYQRLGAHPAQYNGARRAPIRRVGPNAARVSR